MPDDVAISIQNLNKIYKLYDFPQDRLKESLHPLRKKYHHDFYALNDVGFEIKKGETVGIIGKNGSGKSTLLKLITGVLTPSSGSVKVNGKISALLELGAGFNPDLSGIENVYFNGTLMGYTREEMDAKLDDILGFADIGEFIHQQVKTYSSGMFVRLAFAIAINVKPDILIVDEALSVGDLRFQAKCFKKIELLQEQKTTILFVSHDISAVRSYCTRAILMDHGRVAEMGNTDEVCTNYHLKIRAEQVLEKANNLEATETSLISADGKILSVALFDDKGNNIDTFEAGSLLTVRITVKAYEDINSPAVSFSLQNLHGINLLGVTTFYERHPVPKICKDEIRLFEFNFKLSLNAGCFISTAGFADQTDYDVVKVIDNFDNGIVNVFSKTRAYGLFIPENVYIRNTNRENEIKYMSSIKTVTIGDNELILNLNDRHEMKYFEYAHNENTDFDIIVAQHFLRRGDVVLDAGANIGFSSLIFLKYGAERVHSFEPVPHLFQRLEKLKSPKLEVYNSALSDKNGETEIILSQTHNQGHTLNPVFLNYFPSVFGASPEKTITKVVALDSFLPHVKFDFFKVDIEGSELDFLRGARETLCSSPPRVMMIEIYQQIFGEVDCECSKYFKYSKRVAICHKDNSIKLFETDADDNLLLGYKSGPPTYLYSNVPLNL